MTISLAAWQAGLIERVQGDSPTEDIGLVLTRAILRSWRTFRVESCAPLTLSLLGPSASGQLLNRYLDTTASPSSFLAAEGLLFLDFVDRDLPSVPHAASVVALERGVLMARLRESPPPAPATVRRWLRDPSQVLGWGRGTAVVSFRAEPAAILRALLLGQPVPPEGSGAGCVLCAPGLNDYMTQATLAEANLLACLDQPRSVGSLVADGHDEDVIRALATVGALEPKARRAGGPG